MRRLALLTLAAATLAGEDSARPEPSAPPRAIDPGSSAAVYDPLRGMDRSGRIPKVALPADVPHPDRWRYIPEGRIKPGSIFERFFVTTFVSPIVYHEEDIGTGGGIALSDIDFRNQRRREFSAITASQSTEGQENYAFLWKRALHHRDLPGGGVIEEERSFVRVQTGYERARTRRFFGLGPDTTADDETSYTDEASWALIQASNSIPDVGDDWVASGALRAEHRNLTRGRVKDAPSTGAVFPELVAEGDSRDLLWVSAGLRYDTRDSQHQPYRGVRIAYNLDAAPLQDGGDVGFVHEGHANVAVPVWSPFHHGGDGDEENPPTDTIAVDAFFDVAHGDLPFYALPSLGGPDSLRGYIANRFTGRSAWHASAEWRFWPVPRGLRITDAIRLERLGMALFYDLGAVADDVDDLPDAKLRDSWGFGFRMAFERTAVFRVDIGFSDEDTTVTAQFGLPF